MKTNKASKPQRNESYIVEKIMDDEVILYNRSNHHIHNLNRTAAILWNLCDGEMTIKEMITYLHNNFKGNRKTIGDDVASALEEMRKNNLVTFIF